MSVFKPSVLITGAAVCLLGAMLGTVWAESCPTHCPSGKVLLGIAAPMSGPAAAFGQTSLKAVEVAVRELNASGGLMGIPVELVVGDDRCDAGMAVSVARRHVGQNKVNFVIGPLCPAVAIDAATIYAKANVIQFVPTVTTIELTRKGFDNAFRIAEQVSRVLFDTGLGKDVVRFNIENLLRDRTHAKEMAKNICTSIERLNAELQRLHRMIHG